MARLSGQWVCVTRHSTGGNTNTASAPTRSCTDGPCKGAFLTEVGVTVADSAVSLDDDAYAFAGRAPLEDGGNRASDANVL